MRAPKRLSAAAGFMLVVATTLIALAHPAMAGPPYQTDDPEPADFRHFEIYVAAEYDRDADEISGSLPLFDVNYGVLPNVQLTASLPFAYERASDAPPAFGRGGTEFGIKYRFVRETNYLPQVSIYPQVVFPGARPVGGGKPQLLVPVWLQKGFGRWTAFGGGGRWIDRTEGNLNYWVEGLALVRTLSGGATIGAEVFRSTPEAIGEDSKTAVAVGYTTPIAKNRELLLSIGRGIHGDNDFSGYLGYEIRAGPRERRGP